ncbi:hypothetical protein [Thalassobacillus sp. CUG 92003]|uniref:hypothetical protein n=1 Tax=Thalassobacillus sp. CUG 92003 TaxID=2736641 RepID=UPI0015E65933|nr:hypothetical protein [Thalassobacillus sp. CUG 92003]
MTYRVVRAFRDKENGNYTYNKGDIFPVSGEVPAERVEYLLSPENNLGEPVIEKINKATDFGGTEPQVPEKEEVPEASDEKEGLFPKHTGGPWYELSNGEKIQGKDEAIQAEKELA